MARDSHGIYGRSLGPADAQQVMHAHGIRFTRCARELCVKVAGVPNETVAVSSERNAHPGYMQNSSFRLWCSVVVKNTHA